MTDSAVPAVPEDLLARIRFAISNPGAFVKRGDDYAEPVSAWSARAVEHMVNEWLVKRTAVDVAKVRAELARELLATLDYDSQLCAFWACQGPEPEPVSMKTCRVCHVVHDLRNIAGPSKAPTITIADRFGGAPR